MAEISLVNVSKSFGHVNVIDDISLKINSGEFLVFLGPSGSGKTTLLRMIAGLEAIDSGTLLINGVECQQVAPGKRNVAMVFQNYALYPHMTVRENFAFGLKNIRLSQVEIEKRVNEAAQILEMEHLLDRRPSQLSGGQRQRTAIGRAIVKEPAAFLFDEPLSNLDAALRVRTRLELAELHQRVKSTMIYVTHDQIEAMTLANRIVVLNNCRIEQIGTPIEVYNAPASRFVAEFIGSPAMNILKVAIKSVGDKTFCVLDNGIQFEIQAEVLKSEVYEIGIRPEFVSIMQSESEIMGQAAVVEHLGERTIVYVQLENGPLLTAQDDGQSKIKPGDMVSLSLDTKQIHLFDNAGNILTS